MNATFLQVDVGELSRFKANPSSVEALFQEESGMPNAFIKLSKVMRDRVRAVDPEMLAQSLSRLDPALRERLAQRLGQTPEEWARALGGDDLLKMMEERRSRRSGRPGGAAGSRPMLSLDKAWHGVHYLLCGETEPGATLVSQAVLGGAPLGEDDEGFSGYGPARYFTDAQVGQLAVALSRPELAAEAAARFDAARMSDLGIYPGWRSSDADSVLDALRLLRDFYSDAAANGRAVITCLV